ncbi:ferritin-like domain-containing protein [Paludibaculum fermentans]|uniref:ferritin-like domain-containing protein n=1 Tax=Paludibaculum fermentans TaxID=1473598 RepID=UPI003EB9B499
MQQNVLHTCLVENIRDIYDAEKQLTKAIPKLAKAASSDELAEALQEHLKETENQVTRIEQVFKLLEVPARGKTCKGMKGLIEEGAEALSDHDEGVLRDLAIIAAAQRVEHYEISAYGTARALAEQLEQAEVVRLLQQTLKEEATADNKLTECAMSLYDTQSAVQQ